MNTKPLLSGRNSNLELYRIILMLAIVAHHYVVNSGLLPVLENAQMSYKSCSFYLFGMWGKTGINCFVLITGYFMCMSKITLRKFLKLILEVEFYHVVLFLTFYFFHYSNPSLKDFLMMLLPVRSVSDGFVSSFILFYLFIPFLTITVKNLQKRQHLLLISLCLFVYSFLGMIPGIKVCYNYVTWFCVLFLIASYIRFYGFQLLENYRGRFLIASIFVSMSSVVFFVFLQKQYHIPIYTYWLVSDSYAIMAVVTAVCGLMYFKEMKIPQSKLVNRIAASTFGVLLIHANSGSMRQWLWKDTLNVVGQYMNEYAMINAVFSVFSVFSICVLIDQIRIQLFEKPLFKLLDKYLTTNVRTITKR